MGADVWLQAGFNSGGPISQEFFISQMSGKLNTVITQELLPEVDEALRQVFLEKKEARFRRYFIFFDY